MYFALSSFAFPRHKHFYDKIALLTAITIRPTWQGFNCMCVWENLQLVQILFTKVVRNSLKDFPQESQQDARQLSSKQLKRNKICFKWANFGHELWHKCVAKLFWTYEPYLWLYKREAVLIELFQCPGPISASPVLEMIDWLAIYCLCLCCCSFLIRLSLHCPLQ